MDLDQWQRAQQQIIRALTIALLPLLLRFVGRRISTDVLFLVTRVLYDTVEQSRRLSQDLARRYYESDAELAESTAIRRPQIREYDPGALEEGLRYAIPVDEARPMTRNDAGKALRVIQKHVEDAGRREMIATVLNDDSVIGWARVDPRPPTCAFCLMLISRGPVYKTEQSAGGLTQWHPGCTCKVVPVRDEKHWEGRDQYIRANRLWRDSTLGADDPLNAFRRAVEGREGKGTPKRDKGEKTTRRGVRNEPDPIKLAERQLEVLEQNIPKVKSDRAREYHEKQIKVLKRRIADLKKKAA